MLDPMTHMPMNHLPMPMPLQPLQPMAMQKPDSPTSPESPLNAKPPSQDTGELDTKAVPKGASTETIKTTTSSLSQLDPVSFSSTCQRLSDASSSSSSISARHKKHHHRQTKDNADPNDTNRCRYPSKRCPKPRAVKKTGDLHNFCEFHRARANRNQRRFEMKQKQEKPPAPHPPRPLLHLPLLQPPQLAPAPVEWHASGHSSTTDVSASFHHQYATQPPPQVVHGHPTVLYSSYSRPMPHQPPTMQNTVDVVPPPSSLMPARPTPTASSSEWYPWQQELVSAPPAAAAPLAGSASVAMNRLGYSSGIAVEPREFGYAMPCSNAPFQQSTTTTRARNSMVTASAIAPGSASFPGAGPGPMSSMYPPASCTHPVDGTTSLAMFDGPMNSLFD